MERPSLQLRLKSSELNQVHLHKLLVVRIDSQLSFDQHLVDLCKKVTQGIAVLRNITRSLPQRKLQPCNNGCRHTSDQCENF